MNYVSHGPSETAHVAGEQARELVRGHAGAPIVIALEGELGAGKTTFTQAFCRTLGINEGVKSPTFVLMKEYELRNVPGYHKLYHLDCYRLNDASELNTLGIEEIMRRHGVIVLIEWAERVRDVLPEPHITVHIDHISELVRNINITHI